MKKLDALIAGFADEVFRTIRGATLEELAELLGSPMPAEPARRSAARLARGTLAAKWPPSPRSRPERSRRAHQRSAQLELPVAVEAPVVAEITDPELLLRIDAESSPAPARAERLERAARPERTERAERLLRTEPSPEPPPVSEEKPVAPPVLLRANEALVRASSAGVVIRRRKEA
jgi:hypothetical protein